MAAQHRFKGGTFENRYKIVGQLTTLSPLHIGDGQALSNESRLPKPDKDSKVPEFSTVATDESHSAYIPGSTLKGNLRAWLSQIFSAAPFVTKQLATANTARRATKLQEEWQRLKEQQNQDQIRSELHVVEYLFGSAVNEGKLECWDSPMAAPPALPSGQTSSIAYCGYDQSRGTILLKSVAIDPVTGTAARNKLFNYEVVPVGACFDVTVAGQNLSDGELGMLLFALEGFGSKIYPVTLGAMTGIGFGRMDFTLKSVCRLDRTNLKDWLNEAISSGHAGYTGLAKLPSEQTAEVIVAFRNAFKETVKMEG